jgi:hypothetical protein
MYNSESMAAGEEIDENVASDARLESSLSV